MLLFLLEAWYHNCMKEKQLMAKALIRWYQEHKRDLPWRNTSDPYHIWVSEIMLQQTRVEAVKGYYQRFLQAYPTISDLAQASDEELHKIWQGLGYYSRVRNLREAARTCVAQYDGRLPDTYEQLIQLKGIGPYCASAIASFAFHLPYPVVDGNVIRVCARLQMREETFASQKEKRMLSEALRAEMPDAQCDVFNQAIMELGAMVCVPNGAPHCDVCPLAFLCKAYHNGCMEEYPKRPEKKPRMIEYKTVLIFQYEDKIHLVQRKASGLLAGMFVFDMLDGYQPMTEILKQYDPYEILGIQDLPDKVHIFTHKEWHMRTWWIRLRKPMEGIWADRRACEESYAIPSAVESYLNLIPF